MGGDELHVDYPWKNVMDEERVRSVTLRWSPNIRKRVVGQFITEGKIELSKI